MVEVFEEQQPGGLLCVVKLGRATGFKAFFDLYLDGMSVQALLIFKELVEIGRANENRLAIPYLDWAEAQTKHLIRSNTHRIRIWVRDVCDKQCLRSE